MTPVLIGIEHEFRVLDGDRQVDFRQRIHRLGIRGRRLDPTDPNAYRCAWGGAITADGAEAEVATAPVRVRRGFVARAEARARSAEGALRGALPATWRLEGFSTHVSVSIGQHLAEEIAPLYARTFGPALMLLMDRPSSPGLLVRPRPGRLELCGEHVDGDELRAAVAFAVGSIIAISQGLYPPPLRLALVPARERYGWYVDRRAFGCDLYAQGRSARLRRQRGGPSSGQAHLEASWSVARSALRGIASSDDLRVADAVVRGARPLPLETAGAGCPAAHAPRIASTYGLGTRTYERPRFVLSPHAATWDLMVFEVRGARKAFAAVPSEDAASLARRLRAGAFDEVIRRFLAAPATGSTLTRTAALRAPGLYDTIVPRAEISAIEREPDLDAVAPGVVAPLPWWSVPAGIAALIAAILIALRPERLT